MRNDVENNDEVIQMGIDDVGTMIFAVDYRDGKLMILDQTQLPRQEVYIELSDKESVWRAIKTLQVRGAPAIGVAAAYGLYISTRDYIGDIKGFFEHVAEIKEYLNSARPTAVNLEWALTRIEKKLHSAVIEFENAEEPCDLDSLKRIILNEAAEIHDEDESACHHMGVHGLSLLEDGMGILTHCNAGALATSGVGTCLAPLHLGKNRGFKFHIYADETRPLLQGARLTAWELSRNGIQVTLICDNMAATVMKQGKIGAVLVGCDRMAANGDAANKIGTSGVAILAHEYGIPFYVFAPTSTIDLDTASGDEIIIEERDPSEIAELWYAERMAPYNIKIYNPAFDVTDSKYITAIVTEKGIVKPPFAENLRKLMKK